ncbi:hypothetical protein [Rhizobium straminoryzae]|uniref:Uncharacterized protein n=1 Tax=Rhizobium straminoryzae TaxID=1387186 RepID=A0A549TD50_9HYPH|nr:hypothetical protein [Rhizobium straminoryzae]TRL39856.1 hypothetical protein FNA46_07935 [Rhizobium straminoryzae]
MKPRDLIHRLEQLGEDMTDLQRRLLDDLKSYATASEEYLSAVERQIERAALANASVVAEAAWVLHEAEADAAATLRARLSRSAAVASGYRGCLQ